MEIPSKYKTAGTLMLVAGIVNILFSIGITFFIFVYATAIAISTFGLGIVCYACMLWPILPFVTGIVEVIAGIKVMSGARMPGARVVSIVGVIVAALNLSMIQIALEVVALVMLNDESVTRWLQTNDEA